jgi:hypothetical protein
MSNWVLSDLQQEFIRTNCNTMSFDAIAQAIDTTFKRVQLFVYKNHLRPRIGRPFTAGDIEFILDHHRFLSYKDIGKQIGRSADSIKHKCQTNGWKITVDDIEFLRKKYCIPSAFKKGHLPENTLKDGDITIRKDSRGVPYKYIRLSIANWEYLHIYNYEKLHGPVPKGMVLRSRDGDSLNCDPGNWEVISQYENLLRNSGREELTDNYIINILSVRDKSIREEIKNNPELIQLKREELNLRRTIYEREHGNSEENTRHERKAISIQEI